jgi:hypothetical protein
MLLLVWLLLVSALPALELAVGGGTGIGLIAVEASGASYSTSTFKFFGFLDARYGIATFEILVDEKQNYSGLALMAQYPFAFGSYRVTPLAGVGAEIVFKTADMVDPDALNHLFVRSGLHADLPITETFSARPWILYTWYVPNSSEKILEPYRWGLDFSLSLCWKIERKAAE